jgi:hypothetical protein
MFEVSGNKPGANNALEVQVPCIVFFIITPIFVAIRIWSRVRTKVYLGYDDWTILISLVSFRALKFLESGGLTSL